MLASVSNVMGVAMAPHLAVVIPRMLETLRSEEGVQVGGRPVSMSGRDLVRLKSLLDFLACLLAVPTCNFAS